MPWFRLDDKTDEHPKLARVGVLGLGLFVKAGLYCARNLTDGFIPERKAREIAASVFEAGHEPGEWLAQMVQAGLWDKVPDGYRVHDYLEYNPSRAKVEKQRADAKRRKQQWKERQEEQRGNTVPNAKKNAPGNTDSAPEEQNDPKPDPVSIVDSAPAEPDPASLVVQHAKEAGYPWRKPHKHLVAWLKDGVTVEDACLVIDHRIAEWAGTDMARYIRQVTIWGPDKREDYLAQAKRWHEDGRPHKNNNNGFAPSGGYDMQLSNKDMDF